MSFRWVENERESKRRRNGCESRRPETARTAPMESSRRINAAKASETKVKYVVQNPNIYPKIAVERLESGLRPLFSGRKWICRSRQAGEKRSRSSTRAFLSRFASASQLSGEGRRPRLIAHAFRRNGHPVPAQRHHRSGETASPFRRDGIAVPAQRHHRSGATATPSRRVWAPVWSVPGGRNGADRPGSADFQEISACFTTDFGWKSKLTDIFAPAGDPFSCP